MKLIKSFIWLSLNLIQKTKCKVFPEHKKAKKLIMKKISKIFKNGKILESVEQQ